MKLFFLNLMNTFWAQKYGLYTDLGLDFFFGKITSPNDNKITKIAFVQIYSRSASHMNPEMTGLLYYYDGNILLCRPIYD